MLIKDQVLNDEHVGWLVSEYRSSVHLVNRLLLYPARNHRIVEWARNVYETGELDDRESQVIALLIEDDIPSFVHASDGAALLWAIYYARITDKAKKRLLVKYASVENIEAALEISLRLRYADVIPQLKEKFLSP